MSNCVCFWASSTAIIISWQFRHPISRHAHTVHIDKGDISTRENHALSHNKTQTTGTSSDDTNAAIKREAGKSGLHKLAASAQDRLAGRQFMLFGMLNLDVRVGTGVAARLVTVRRDVVKVARGSKRRSQSGSGSSPRSMPQHRSEDGLSRGHCGDCV